MAAILSVTYTPNYSGCHRICFKSTQPEYCVYLDNSPSVAGVEKTTTIDLTDYEECLVDYPIPIGCSGTELTGYVQPCCTDATSTDNRVPFDTTYPYTECTSYNILCTESGIGEFSIINPGYGWPVGVTPTITVTDTSGYGSGFTGTVNMLCEPGENFCSIESITIDNPGESYYFLNTLSVDIAPAPTCISDELITNGDFSDGLNGWTTTPTGLVPEAWTITGLYYAKYNIEAYGATQPGTISQSILTPGKTYDISFELTIGVTNGSAYVVVSAGTLDPSGTQPNQYLHTQLVGPLFTGVISTTLTCIGTNEFSIYIYSDVAEGIASRAQVTNVSVIEICDAVLPEVEVSMVDDCGTFTVTNCDGTPNPTTYQLWGGSQYAINVCSGAEPNAPKYVIQSGPYGPELIDAFPFDNTNFTGSNLIWGPPSPCNFLVPHFYVDGYGSTIPIFADNGIVTSPAFLEIGAQYRILYTTYTDNPPNKLVRWTSGPGVPIDIAVQTGLSEDVEIFITANSTSFTATVFENVENVCFYITSVRKVLDQVSCCDCTEYQIVTRADIDLYYTDCNQGVQTISVAAGLPGVTICCVRSSIFPVTSSDNQYILSITEVGSCTL